MSLQVTDLGDRKWTHFETATAMAAAVETDCTKALEYDPDTKWSGGNWQQALTRARQGELARVSSSDAFIDRMEDLAALETHAFETQAAVAGGAVNVPAFLSGHPASMRLRRRVMKQQAPLVVMVDCFASYGVSTKSIERRGAAVLALVRAMSAIRPVTLLAFCALGGSTTTVHSFRVETAPLDLARAAWALGSPNVLRHHFHALRGKITDNPACYEGGFSDPDATADLAKALGFEDYVSTGAMVGACPDWQSDEAAADWVRQTLAASIAD
jgi:hypothetical protein